MSSMISQSSPRFAHRQHHQVTTAAFVVLFWGAAALAVVGVHEAFDATIWQLAFALKVGAIVLAGWGYVRLTASDATLHHGLGVGVIWLLLAILSEIVMWAAGHRHWTILLGEQARPLLRSLMLFIWITAPALFARRHD